MAIVVDQMVTEAALTRTGGRRTRGRLVVVLQRPLNEHVDEVHGLHSVAGRREHVARAHPVVRLPRHVRHEVHRPVQQRRLGRRQPGATKPCTVILRLAPRHLLHRQCVQQPTGELSELW